MRHSRALTIFTNTVNTLTIITENTKEYIEISLKLMVLARKN